MKTYEKPSMKIELLVQDAQLANDGKLTLAGDEVSIPAPEDWLDT